MSYASDPRYPFSSAISNTNKVEIVAEITTNAGNRDTQKNLIINAALSGADSVKLQSRDVETFYPKDQLNEKHDSPFECIARL